LVSTTESFLLFAVLGYTSSIFNYPFLGHKENIFIVIGFALISNYIVFNKNGRAKNIVEKKPSLWGNNKLSWIVTLVVTIVIDSWLFWGPWHIKAILEKS
jgi:hypothetical protein